MSVLIESSRSVVGDHVCERSPGIIVYRPARLMGLRADGLRQPIPSRQRPNGGFDYTAVTTATSNSYMAAGSPTIAAK